MDAATLGVLGVSSVAGLGMLSFLAVQGRSSSRTHTPRPGWMARRKARDGVTHKAGLIGVGWQSSSTPVRLGVLALNHHGYVSGAPGSGKTTFLRNLIDGYPGPVVILDAKGDMSLADTVWGMGGLVWEIGAPLKLDVLDDEPAILAQQLLEGETFTDRAAVYRAIAEHAVLRAATVLHWRAEPREPARILDLLASPDILSEAIRAAMPAGDRMAQRWITELANPSRTVLEGFQTFSERLGSLLDSPAGESLGTGTASIRLQDIVANSGKLLIRLDPRYGSTSRKVGAWTLVAMLRMASEMRRARWRGNCLFVIDEPRLLGHEGRHLIDLFGTARDAGIGLVVADQGVAGLVAVHPDMPNAVLRSTGWQMAFRQGSEQDATTMSGAFGMQWREDVTRASDGRTSTRLVEEPKVRASWLQELSTAHGWLHAAPIGIGAVEQIASIVVAKPRVLPRRSGLMLPAAAGVHTVPISTGDTTNEGVSAEEWARRRIERLVGGPDGDGCRAWQRRDGYDSKGRPQCQWDGRIQAVARVLVLWRDGEIPRYWEVHHHCLHRWCVEVTHLEAMPKWEHRRLHQRLDAEAPVAVVEVAEEVVPESVGVEARRVRVGELHGQGWSIRKIAEAIGVSRETARRDIEVLTHVSDVSPDVSGHL